MNDFSNKLKELRNELNKSQEEVAKDLNKTRSALANYEQGTREPNYALLKLICEYYDVSSDYLLNINQRETNQSKNFIFNIQNNYNK